MKKNGAKCRTDLVFDTRMNLAEAQEKSSTLEHTDRPWRLGSCYSAEIWETVKEKKWHSGICDYTRQNKSGSNNVFADRTNVGWLGDATQCDHMSCWCLPWPQNNCNGIQHHDINMFPSSDLHQGTTQSFQLLKQIFFKHWFLYRVCVVTVTNGIEAAT